MFAIEGSVDEAKLKEYVSSIVALVMALLSAFACSFGYMRRVADDAFKYVTCRKIMSTEDRKEEIIRLNALIDLIERAAKENRGQWESSSGKAGWLTCFKKN